MTIVPLPVPVVGDEIFFFYQKKKKDEDYRNNVSQNVCHQRRGSVLSRFLVWECMAGRVYVAGMTKC